MQSVSDLCHSLFSFTFKYSSCFEISGQEDDTIDYDEGIKITPFNMKDELEEGHFDKEGTYIFKKEVIAMN